MCAWRGNRIEAENRKFGKVGLITRSIVSAFAYLLLRGLFRALRSVGCCALFVSIRKENFRIIFINFVEKKRTFFLPFLCNWKRISTTFRIIFLKINKHIISIVKLIGGYELLLVIIQISIFTIRIEFQWIFLYKCNQSAVILSVWIKCGFFFSSHLWDIFCFGGFIQVPVFGLKKIYIKTFHC